MKDNAERSIRSVQIWSIGLTVLAYPYILFALIAEPVEFSEAIAFVTAFLIGLSLLASVLALISFSKERRRNFSLLLQTFEIAFFFHLAGMFIILFVPRIILRLIYHAKFNSTWPLGI